MIVLSFDCANRSLAVCCIYVNEHIMSDLAEAVAKKNPDEVVRLIQTYVVHYYSKVFDITKGAKLKTEARTSLLKDVLTSIDHVYVEYQMVHNDKSRCVSNQIVYHYTDSKKTGLVKLVMPSLKNKLQFGEGLDYGTFAAKYRTKYTANKNHSKANFKHLLHTFGYTGILKDNRIKGKNVDDIADAWMQVFGQIKASA
jgi:hypothetical protein